MPEPEWHTIDGNQFDSVSALVSHQKVGMFEPDWDTKETIISSIRFRLLFLIKKSVCLNQTGTQKRQ